MKMACVRQHNITVILIHVSFILVSHFGARTQPDIFNIIFNFFQTCRLGRHAPITKVLRDGILKVGKKQAEKLANEDTEQWFDLIGDSPTASLVKLYSQVNYITVTFKIPFAKNFLWYVSIS